MLFVPLLSVRKSLLTQTTVKPPIYLQRRPMPSEKDDYQLCFLGNWILLAMQLMIVLIAD